MTSTMRHTLGRLSPARAKRRERRTARAASDTEIDASNAPPPGRLPTWSSEVTPGKKGFEREAHRPKVFLRTLQPVDYGNHFQDLATELLGLIHCLHRRAAGGRHVLEQDDPRSSFEMSIDPLIGAVPLDLLA